MEKKKVRVFEKRISLLLFCTLFCLIIMGLTVSSSLAAEKITLYGILERYPNTKVRLKAAAEEYKDAK